MIIDGRQRAREWEETIARSLLRTGITPTLAIVVIGDDPVIASFVRIKKRVAERIGVTMREVAFPSSATGEEVARAVKTLADDASIDGIVVQLPLPLHMDTDMILRDIPITKDVDVLARDAVALFAQGNAPILPPVAAAVQDILECGKVSVEGKEVLVLGHGRLVGAPVALLMRHNGAHVTVIDRPVADLLREVRESEIIISGVGKPGMLTPEMFTEGSVLIDAGTSESAGRVVGDAHPDCASRVALSTPVPGGVGPLAVVMLFKNLALLAEQRHAS
jgi:methylenetetrahydrofolate dehydrogenase (NADP+)/methenyltetrahydrofolate cyclohydrolase